MDDSPMIAQAIRLEAAVAVTRFLRISSCRTKVIRVHMEEV